MSVDDYGFEYVQIALLLEDEKQRYRVKFIFLYKLPENGNSIITMQNL